MVVSPVFSVSNAKVYGRDISAEIIMATADMQFLSFFAIGK
jgi:hypothetical protein